MKITHRAIKVKCDYCPSTKDIIELQDIKTKEIQGFYCGECLSMDMDHYNYRVKHV